MLIYIILMLALAYFFAKGRAEAFSRQIQASGGILSGCLRNKNRPQHPADSLSVLCCQRLLDADCLPAFQNHP